MASTEVKLEDLTRILREGAGTDESVDLDGIAVIDTYFDELGYDSLAMLETVTRIGREYGIKIDDHVITAAHTPRELLKVVNGTA